ncbi:hypothetical protein BH24ACT6_BH24ACT6_21640 [soil metagenome]
MWSTLRSPAVQNRRPRLGPDVPIQPAATVIVVRDAPGGLEVLMLRRAAGAIFAGGA